MEDTIFWSRVQFAFTITYHYLFPQLTMGLAWIIVYFKWRHLRTGEERFASATRFWARIFGINFAVGVVTGIPMEFQFGTNWAGFLENFPATSHWPDARDGRHVRIFPRKRDDRGHGLGRKAARLTQTFSGHSRRGIAGSWLSAYFILVTNAFMQHPVGYTTATDGSLRLDNFATVFAESLGAGHVLS